MWTLGRRNWRQVRRFFSSSAAAARDVIADEGAWSYSDEWCNNGGQLVFRSSSKQGNGVISVIAYPSSQPAPERWPAIEKSIQQRHELINPNFVNDGKFKILGYQWRILGFNNTLRSTTKVMATYCKSDPASIYLMQQPHCLPLPYTRSMVSAGLTALASSGYDIFGAATGRKNMKILCVGHGGGSIPLFLASKIKGAIVHIVEIDPVVITASVQAMGFPASAMKESLKNSSHGQSISVDELLWECLSERFVLHRADAEDFILNDSNIYDLVFIDAYDGDNIFPYELWDRQGPFVESLRSRVHPVHGIVVVNLHDSEGLSMGKSGYSLAQSILPVGGYVSGVGKAYKKNFGMAFSILVPWNDGNIILVALSGAGLGVGCHEVDRNLVLNALVSKCYLIVCAGLAVSLFTIHQYRIYVG